MTPEEQQKADAWILLSDKDAVAKRIGQMVIEIFENTSSATWLSQRLIDADKASYKSPFRMYFEQQLERNLRLILAEGVQDRLEEIVRPMIHEAVKEHINAISTELNALKKLKSKGPIHGRR